MVGEKGGMSDVGGGQIVGDNGRRDE